MKFTKIISLLLLVVMCLGVFAACGDKGNTNQGGDDNKPKVTLTVWASQEDQAMVKEMCDAYAAANPDKTYKFLFGIQGENDAADKVLNDVTSGPDVFSFASDQINKLYTGGALARLGGAILDEVIGRAVQHGCVNTWGVTIDINVKYRKPVPLNAELICVGKIVKESSLTKACFIKQFSV